MRARALLPRRSVRLVCLDDGRGVAEALAAWLIADGFTDVAVLDGGTRAWATAGGELFSGVNVPSKAFGEWVEHHYGTESVDPPELKSWLDSGRKMVVLDSRTEAEFRRMSIPTGISVPGGELAYRIGDLAPDPDTLVVVNCAGRTRSIMGAESLRRAGIPNKVVALAQRHHGLGAGRACAASRAARNASRPARRRPPPSPSPAPALLPRRPACAWSTPEQVAGFAADPARSLYLLDVRDPAEFRAAHHPASRNAPGGQLVQATDGWIAVRNARIVLLDDDGVRARMAAAWLRQMGQADVFVVDGGFAALGDLGPAPGAVPELAAPVPTIEVLRLTEALDAGTPTVIVDVARSLDYRDGHIPGAVWGVRGRLGVLAEALAGARLVAATSPDGALARLAVAELGALGAAEVVALEGGTAAWHAFGRPLVKDRTTPPDAACVDAYLRPYDRNSGVEAAMREYLSWEIELVHAIARDGTVRFGVAAHA